MNKRPSANVFAAGKRHAKPKSAVNLAQPTEWDMGVRNPNQDRLKVIEALTELDPKTGKEVPNPNGVKRARRIDLAEYYFRKGRFDARQLAACKKLAEAWELTQLSGEAIKKVQVDQTPDHGAIAAEQVDRIARFHAIRRLIPNADWPLLECVAIKNWSVAQIGYRDWRTTQGLRKLGEAATRLAERLGL